MKPSVFIDYPINKCGEFVGLSFPQIIYNYFRESNDVVLAESMVKSDFLWVFGAGSHYSDGRSTVEKLCRRLLQNKYYSPIHLKMFGFDRLQKRNKKYEERVYRYQKNNPKGKIIHRVDDRFTLLCKLYGFDKSVTYINSLAYKTIVQTEYCRQIWENDQNTIFGRQLGIKLKNPVKLYNPVDTSIFTDSGPRIRLPGKFNILHVATSAMPRKGLGTVLEIANLLKNNEEFHFVLIGNQVHDPLFGHNIQEFSNVTQIEPITNRVELSTYYRSCDLLLFPSDYDCSPNVVLEAMSSGVPVLLKDSGGTPELISKGGITAGLLIDSKNPILSVKTAVERITDLRLGALTMIKNYHDIDLVGPKALELMLG